MPIRLVIADDHLLVLAALKHLIHQEQEFDVLACCKDGEEALHAVRQHQPDVLLLDIHMPRKDGLAVLRDMRKEKLSTRVVLLTAALDDDQVLEAMRLGVEGVVLKEMTPQQLMQCIRKVHAGDLWLEKQSVSRAMEKLLRREAAAREIAKVLTRREMEVVRLMASGLRNKEIADQLSISEGTVKIHLHKGYEKLQVQSRMELVRYLHTKGLV
jgi:two-component system, NarL family, nitrate/nitrite response regulator NarL